MTQSNVTKRALLVSVLSLLLCFSMLLGTTYAWFTDTVASTGNIIQSGILDADLIDANGNSLEGKPLTFQKAEGAPADEKVLWEPGCTYNLQDFKVVNKGNLAFKFKVLSQASRETISSSRQLIGRFLTVTRKIPSILIVGITCFPAKRSPLIMVLVFVSQVI